MGKTKRMFMILSNYSVLNLYDVQVFKNGRSRDSCLVVRKTASWKTTIHADTFETCKQMMF